jgi:hypothetical protein
VASPSAADVTARFTRAGLWVAIVVMSGWHILATLPFVIQVGASQGLVASGALIWAGYAVLGVVSAVSALGCGRVGQRATDWWYVAWRRGWLPWAVCVLLLAGVAANALTLSGGFFGSPAFGFTSAGWFALVALWHRRLAELLAFFAANAVVGLLALAVLHEVSRAHLAMFLVSACGSSVFQVTIYIGSRAVATVAGNAAEAAEAAARARYTRMAADAVQAQRRARYELVRASVIRLLEGLATGSLDLGSALVRQEITVAQTRLRRFLVENDDVPDPFSHELRACADAAERRGIAVDLIAAAGTVPLLPVGDRRALVEPVIQVLAAAASWARITVIASPAEVTVAILADATLPGLDLAAASRLVRCDWDEVEGKTLWAQARWTRPSASLSWTTMTSS